MRREERNSPKPQREHRRNDPTRGEQHECRAVRAETIFHCADKRGTEETTYICDRYY